MIYDDPLEEAMHNLGWCKWAENVHDHEESDTTMPEKLRNELDRLGYVVIEKWTDDE